MFQDEARFGRISRGRNCWQKKPFRPVVKAMMTQEYTYAYAAVCPSDGVMDSLILPQVNGECMSVFLEEVGVRHADENVVMIMDGAGWHHSKELRVPENIRLYFLPPYSPELNPQEHVWDELREKWFHNKAYESLEALEADLEKGLLSLENDRKVIRSITGWDWINSIVFI